ncbi:MAG TPA: thioredoxin [Longilinea sp.]|nr:thioredoxin [Longilinea sp.]
MTSEFVVDVFESNFEFEVLAYSQNRPVVVDFWAEWCRPCKALTPMLERLASETEGSFRLAKLDVEANPNLALQYGVHSIPTVKAFSQGQVVGELVGLQPENRLRDFLGKLMPPSPASLALEKGQNMVAGYQWKEAEGIFHQVLATEPEQPAALLGLAMALLGQGKGSEALQILSAFPASKEYARAESLRAYADALNSLEKDSLPAETDLDAAFANCVRLAKRGNIPAALDGLLDILRQDKRYRNGAAKQLVLGLLELLGSDDVQSRAYRSELAMILY